MARKNIVKRRAWEVAQVAGAEGGVEGERRLERRWGQGARSCGFVSCLIKSYLPHSIIKPIKPTLGQSSSRLTRL